MQILDHNLVLQKSRPRISVLDFERGALIESIQAILEGKNIIAAYLFGSFARKEMNLWSDIDLIIIKDSSLPFIERPREFFGLYNIGVPLDILVYTPEEFAKMQSEKTGFWQEVKAELIQLA